MRPLLLLLPLLVLGCPELPDDDDGAEGEGEGGEGEGEGEAVPCVVEPSRCDFGFVTINTPTPCVLDVDLAGCGGAPELSSSVFRISTGAPLTIVATATEPGVVSEVLLLRDGDDVIAVPLRLEAVAPLTCGIAITAVNDVVGETEVAPGDVVTLSATERALTHEWRLVSRPEDGVLVGLDASTTELLTGVAGDYGVELTVTDETGATRSCRFDVVAQPVGTLFVQATWVGDADLNLHVARDGAFCSADDCFVDNATTTWGAQHRAFDHMETVSVADPAGAYTIATSVHGLHESTVFVRLFDDGQLRGEWVVSLEDSSFAFGVIDYDTGFVDDLTDEQQQPLAGACLGP